MALLFVCVSKIVFFFVLFVFFSVRHFSRTTACRILKIGTNVGYDLCIVGKRTQSLRSKFWTSVSVFVSKWRALVLDSRSRVSGFFTPSEHQVLCSWARHLLTLLSTAYYPGRSVHNIQNEGVAVYIRVQTRPWNARVIKFFFKIRELLGNLWCVREEWNFAKKKKKIVRKVRDFTFQLCIARMFGLDVSFLLNSYSFWYCQSNLNLLKGNVRKFW